MTVSPSEDYELCIIYKSARGKPAGAFALGLLIAAVGARFMVPKKPCVHLGCSRLVDVGDTYCADHAVQEKRERDRSSQQRRRTDRPSRKWYSKAAWRGKNGRRTLQLEKEPICRLCPDHSKQLATVADHVTPHRDDYALFWFGELQSLCKSCHDIKKQREERRSQGGGDGKVHGPRN